MPELPEVETMRRGIAGIVGCRIKGIAAAPCQKRPLTIEPNLAVWNRHLVDQPITAVSRLGKRVILEVGADWRVVIEPRMTGLVLLADPPNEEHLRVVFELKSRTHPRLLFWDRRGLGVLRLLSRSELDARLTSSGLGPDALEISLAELRTRLEPSRRAIKVALLDQRALAGVGNLYASEMLFAARIDPHAPCDALSPAQWKRLHMALHEILSTAIRYEGSTLGDGTYRNALNRNGSYQNHHQVYARAGKNCPRCRRSILRVVQAQRATFYCAHCQRP